MSQQYEDEIDHYIDRLEDAWQETAEVQLDCVLPPVEHPGYADIAVELFRVDLDHRFSKGHQSSIDDYIQRYSDVLSNHQRLASLAYEEYRLRKQAGHTVTPQDYFEKYGVDVTEWADAAELSTLGPSLESVVDGHPVDDPALVPGATFEGFTLNRELGSGALARVFLASQSGVADREVVLKFSAVRTVEIDRLGKLQHSSIVPILSVHPYRNGAAICMPYLGDATLAQTLSDLEENNLDANSRDTLAIRVGTAVASALVHSHTKDVLHGDIKPANILIADDGTPLLLDFNLAGDLGDLRPETIGGTLRYMPPEHRQLFESGSSFLLPDVRCDIYSLGVVLREILTGTAFESPDGFEISASPALSAIVAKCCEADPDQRYSTADDLLEDLQRHAANYPLKHQSEPSIRERCAKWARRHPTLTSNASLLAISGLIIVALATVLAGRSRQLSQANATTQYAKFQRRVPGVVSSLFVRRDSDNSIERGIEDARDLLGSVKANGSYAVSPLLSEPDQRAQTESIGRLLYHLARARWHQSRATPDAAERDRLQALAREANDEADRWFHKQGVNTPAAIEAQSRRLSGDPVTRVAEPTGGSRVEQLLYATELVEAKRNEEAVRYLESVKERFADDASFWALMGSSYVGIKNHSKAETCLTVALSLNPDSWFDLTDRGLARMALREFEGAEADFTDVISLRPDYFGGFLNRAIARARLRDFKGAVEDLDQVIALNGPTRAYFLRSRYRAALGDREGSAEDRKRGIEATPKDEVSWVSRGFARMKDDPDGAMEDFREAVKLNPLSVDGWRNIASLYSEHLNLPDKSAEALSTLIDAGIEDSGAYAGRAVLYAREGREAEALADIEQAMKLDDAPMTVYQAACVYALLAATDKKYEPRAVSLLASSLTKLPRVLLPFAPKDKDLDSIRKSSGYVKAMETAATLYELDRAGRK